MRAEVVANMLVPSRRSVEVNEKLDNVWVKGHTDFGSLTLLFR